MENNLFNIDNFNVINDDEYYYVFRALNNADNKDIENGTITGENGVIERIRTDRERFEEENSDAPRYKGSSEKSLVETWDHIKQHYIKETNCISLSSNSNVSVVYGEGYKDKYIMVKVPKKDMGKTYFAGQYMIDELSKIIDEAIKKVSNKSDLLKVLQNIEESQNIEDIRELTSSIYKKCSSQGIYTGKKNQLENKQSIVDRLGNKQFFSAEQQLEYTRIISKLSILEATGNIGTILPRTRDNQSLIATIGMAFSSGELIHYGDIEQNELIEISRPMMDMISLVQQMKDRDKSNTNLKELENQLIKYANDGYTVLEENGVVYFYNGNNKIEIPNINSSILFEERKDINEQLSLENVYEFTKGEIGYGKAKQVINFAYQLSKAKQKSHELVKILKTIAPNNPIINKMDSECFVINSNIVRRQDGNGVKICESVNLDSNRTRKKIVSEEEQKTIVEMINSMNDAELKEFNSNLYSGAILQRISNGTEAKNENEYYAEAIIDTLDIARIYKKNTNKDKTLNENERQKIIGMLKNVNCKRIYNAFIASGVNQENISDYIINILAEGGYKGYSIEELSKLDNLEEIIKINVENKNLKGHIYPSTMERLRGINDNDNIVEGTEINLRDYQQETIDNVDRIFAEGKRFAGVVLPTGAGKSFVAMTEMLKKQNGNILYIAPQQEILSQIQRHILKNIANVEVLTTDEIETLKKEQNVTNSNQLKLPNGKILPTQASEYVKNVFPHLKLLCYQGLSSKNESELTEEEKSQKESEERELRDILKNADADLIVFDELHRSGAKTWKGVVNQLIDANSNADILGITATPIRDTDHVDMMREIATMVNTYSEEKLNTKQYLGYEMYLTDAIQRGLVVEPQLVSFDFMLRDTDEYQEIVEMIASEKDENKKKELIEIKEQIDDLISGDTEITEHIKNNISQKESEAIGKIIKDTIQKKDGRYIVFLPQHSGNDNLSETQYFEQQEQKIRELLSEVDENAEIYRLSSDDKKTENHRAITDFENSSSEHLKVMLAINKLNEGVHVDGINGEIMYRKINDGSTILYLQQLGRVIYSLDPNKHVLEDEIPIVYDIYNNYLVQDLNRTINQTTPKSDLQRLQEIIDWMDKHDYENLDINSKDINEARKAVALKKIQNKYKKYRDGIDNPRLSKSDIYEIEQILALANSIDLFNKDLGERIVPPGEKELNEVQLFKITATQKNFLELYKKANKVRGNSERHQNRPTAKLNDIMDILSTLSSNDIFISNNLIKYNDKLSDVISKCPKEFRTILQEELYMYEEDYPIGKEYNFAKASFRDNQVWKYFENSDVRKLYTCGIFEDVDNDYLADIQDENKRARLSRDALSNNFVVVGPEKLKHLHVKTGTIYDEDGNVFKIEEKDEHSQSDFEELVSIIESLYNEYNCSFLANEQEESIPEYIRDYVYSLTGKYPRNTTIPPKYKFKEKIINAREYLEGKDLDIDTVIRYKKYGILPLNLNEDGIDLDTGLSKDEFGISPEKFVENQKNKKRFDKIIKVLSDGLETLISREQCSFANENVEEILDCSPLQLYTAMWDFAPNDILRLGHAYNIREEILFARNYLENLDIDYSDKEMITKYKMLGILPIHLDEKGIDIETGLSKEQLHFKRNLSEEYESAYEKRTIEKEQERAEQRQRSENNRKMNKEKRKSEAMELAKNMFKGIDIATELLKKGIIVEGQDIERSTTVKDLFINSGYTNQEEIKDLCLQMGIDIKDNIGEKLSFIKSAYNYQEPRSGLGKIYSELFISYYDHMFELVQLGIVPVSKNGLVQKGPYKSSVPVSKNGIIQIGKFKGRPVMDYSSLKEEVQQEEQKRYISNDDGYNENGEFLYSGKFYTYNPSTGKKADGTYAIEARNERGFNPDKTYKDTGELYDENGLDFDYRNREGIDTIYGFGKDGYYYKKQEDGTYINTYLKHNPVGFKADKRHAVTKMAVDIRGFNIDGICKRNKDSIYDENGFKQDGTFQETGELYHNGYNAYGVDENGKNKNGRVHSDIIFTQGYIDAIMSGKKNTYLKQFYKNINKTNYNKILAEVDIRICRASLMYPEIQEKIQQNIRKCTMKLTEWKRDLQKLEAEKVTNQEEIEKYKRSIEILKERIASIDPMER